MAIPFSIPISKMLHLLKIILLKSIFVLHYVTFSAIWPISEFRKRVIRDQTSVSSSCPCSILLWFLTITMIPFKRHWVLMCRWYLRLPKWERRISKRMDFYAMKLTWNSVFQFGWNFFKDVYPLIITDSVYPVPIERTMKPSSMKSKDWLGNNNI